MYPENVRERDVEKLKLNLNPSDLSPNHLSNVMKLNARVGKCTSK